MLKHLKVQTVCGLIELVDAGKQLSRVTPPKLVRKVSDELREHLLPSTPVGKAERALEIGILNIVAGLSREQKIELVALMWLGRDGGDWDHLMSRGQVEVDDTNSNMPIYVTDKTDLDEYLEAGLEQLGVPGRRKAPQHA